MQHLKLIWNETSVQKFDSQFWESDSISTYNFWTNQTQTDYISAQFTNDMSIGQLLSNHDDPVTVKYYLGTIVFMNNIF